MSDSPAMPFPRALWDDLESVDPKRAAANAGATHEAGKGYVIDFLGAPFVVDPDKRLVSGPPTRTRADFAKALVLVVHLAHCGRTDPPDPAGRLVGAMEVPGGAMFFRGPHAVSTAPLEASYGKAPSVLAARALELGARKLEPYLFAWRVLPKVDMALMLYPEDEEFPAKGSWLVDAHCHYYMPLDAVWGCFNCATSELLPLAAAK
ncbi:MAG: DUF3786 domain-containing protein [Deltaproteobacteria bacterium]|nr:DUF3786 domain-containing protein [Deltaproteobacteria bacterium]